MTTLKVSSPAELISAVPFLVGFHPADSLTVVVMHGPRITFAVRIDLPEHDTPEEEARAAVLHLATVVVQQQAEAVTIIGYGEEPRVTPAVRHIADAFRKAKVAIVDELRVTDGRYWSYLCTDLACCPPEGLLCEPAFSVVATEATFAGAVALPSREALAAQLAPVTGDDREAMTTATARAVLRLAALAAERPPAATPAASAEKRSADYHDERAPLLAAAASDPSQPGPTELGLSNVIWASLGVTAPPEPEGPPVPEGPPEPEPTVSSADLLSDEEHFFSLVRSAGRTAVREAERRYSTGGRLTDDEAAWLGVLLLHMPVRDYAWTRTRTREWELALWSDLTRRVEPRYLAAPASLLAFVAWRSGLGPLANVAVERALDQKLEYSLANLMQGVLITGLPPSVLDGWPAVEGLPPLMAPVDPEEDPGGGPDDGPQPDLPVHFRPNAVAEPAEPADPTEPAEPPERAEPAAPAKDHGTDQVRQHEECPDGAADRQRAEAPKQTSIPVHVRSDAAPAGSRSRPGDGPGRREKRSQKGHRTSHRRL